MIELNIKKIIIGLLICLILISGCSTKRESATSYNNDTIKIQDKPFKIAVKNPSEIISYEIYYDSDEYEENYGKFSDYLNEEDIEEFKWYSSQHTLLKKEGFNNYFNYVARYKNDLDYQFNVIINFFDSKEQVLKFIKEVWLDTTPGREKTINKIGDNIIIGVPDAFRFFWYNDDEMYVILYGERLYPEFEEVKPLVSVYLDQYPSKVDIEELDLAS